MREQIVVVHLEDNADEKILTWMEEQEATKMIAVYFSEPESPMLSNMALAVGANKVYMIEIKPTEDTVAFKAKKLIAIAEKEHAHVIATGLQLYHVVRSLIYNENIIKIVSPEAQL